MNYKILDRFQLKVLMVIFMVMDHLGEFINGVPVWFRYFGRVVAPIFIFFVYEGYYRTRNRGKYLKRLLIGAEIMALGSIILSIIFKQPKTSGIRRNIPIGNIYIISFIAISIIAVLLYTSYKKEVITQHEARVIGLILIIISFFTQGLSRSTTVEFIRNNIFLAMAYAVILLNELEKYRARDKEKKDVSVFGIIGVSIATVFTEGSIMVLGIIFILDKLKGKKLAPYIAYGILSLLFFPLNNPSTLGYEECCQWMMIFSIVFVLLYNRKKGKDYKYFFYVFYPVHIWVLYTIAYFVNK